MENSSRCGICKIDDHRASFAKYLTSKKNLVNEHQTDVIIQELLSKEPIENKFANVYNPKPLREIVRDNFKLDDRQLNKELAKKTIHPYYFNDRTLQVGFNITWQSHHINHANSKITNKPIFSEFGIELQCINKIPKDKAIVYSN